MSMTEDFSDHDNLMPDMSYNNMSSDYFYHDNLTPPDMSYNNMSSDYFYKDLTSGDFANASLDNANFQGANLHGADFYNASLISADLSYLDFGTDADGEDILGSIDFSFAQMMSADLSGSNFSGDTSFDSADLTGAKFVDATVRASMVSLNSNSADFSSADLTGVDFSSANLDGSDFENADADGATFNYASLQSADFSCADLDSADFQSADLDNANFQGANLHGADFYNASLVSADLSYLDFGTDENGEDILGSVDFSFAQMMSADLSGSNFSDGTNFDSADLAGAKFVEATVRSSMVWLNANSADFSSADLTGVDFSSANLDGADFEYADADGAIFNYASLQSAYFYDTDLDGANFSGADLQSADFSNASLIGANLSNLSSDSTSYMSIDFSFAQMMSADLSGSKFNWNTSFEHANLTDAKFVGSGFGMTSMSNIVADGADFSGSIFDESSFANSSLVSANFDNTELYWSGYFKGATLTDASFVSADFHEYANFASADLDGANFSGADLQSADFSGASLIGANLSNLSSDITSYMSIDFSNAQMMSADLSGSKFNWNTSFEHANLTDAKFVGSGFGMTSMSNIVADGADFSGSIFDESSFANSSLVSANFDNTELYWSGYFTGATLTDASFVSADFHEYANFASADLDGANFSGADLQSADFSNASLIGADLTGVDLSLVSSFDQADMTDALIDPGQEQYLSAGQQLQVKLDLPLALGVDDAIVLEDESYINQINVLEDVTKIELKNGAPDWVQFDLETYTITGSPKNTDVGEHILYFNVYGAGDEVVEDSFTLTVENVNDDPVITSTAHTEVLQDQPYSYTFNVSDEDFDDILTLSVNTMPEWLSFDPNSGVLSGTPGNDEVGSHPVWLRVADVAGEAAGTYLEQRFDVVVENVNDAPTLSTTSSLTITEDGATDQISYTGFDIDPTNDELSFIFSQPQHGTVSDEGNTFIYTPFADYSGSDSFKITVSDGTLDAYKIVDILVTAVNDKPLVSVSANAGEETTAIEDQLYSFTFLGSDVDQGDIVTLTAPILPAWLSFEQSTGVLSGTPEDAHVGNHPVSIVATDESGGFSEQNFSIEVTNSDDAPDGVISLVGSEIVGHYLSVEWSGFVTDGGVSEIVSYSLIHNEEVLPITVDDLEAPYIPILRDYVGSTLSLRANYLDGTSNPEVIESDISEIVKENIINGYSFGPHFDSSLYDDFSFYIVHENLHEVNLRGSNLSNLSSHSISLAGADLGEATLDYVSFTHSDLSGAVLNDASAKNMSGLGATFVAGDLSNTNFSNADFEYANLSSALMDTSKFTGANFSNAILIAADLDDADFTDANFTDANLTGVDLSNVTLTNANFTDAIVSYGQGQYAPGATERTDETLLDVYKPGADLTDYDIVLDGMDLSEMDLSNTIWASDGVTGSNFTNASLIGATLPLRSTQDNNFYGADLTDANLSGFSAWADGTNFTNASFTDADLTDSDYYRVEMTGVDLNGADVSGAFFLDVALLGVDFSNVVNLSEADFRSVLIDADQAEHFGDTQGYLVSDEISIDVSGGEMIYSLHKSAKLAGLDLNPIRPLELDSPRMSPWLVKTVRFDHLDLRYADLTGSQLDFAAYSHSNLSDLQGSEGQFRFNEFHDTELGSADFENADLRSSYFSNSDLRNVDFISSDLSHSYFSSVDLQGADFSNADLRSVVFQWNSENGLESPFDANFSGANLQNSSFYDVDLSSVDFTGADLRGVNFDDGVSGLDTALLNEATLVDLQTFDLLSAEQKVLVKLDNTFNSGDINGYSDILSPNTFLPGYSASDIAQYHGDIFREIDLSGSTLNYSDFSGVDLTNTNFSGSDLTGVVFDNSTVLTGAIFDNAIVNGSALDFLSPEQKESLAIIVDGHALIPGAELSGIDLHQKFLIDIDLQGAVLTSSVLTETDFGGANLHNTKLSSADLTDALFRGTDLTDANLEGAILANTNLENADLEAANLRSAILSDTNFQGANLVDADLSHSVMTNADFSFANLQDADLNDVNLTSVNFNGAFLFGANLNNAIVTENTWNTLSPTQKSEAYFTSHDQIPNIPNNSIALTDGSFISRVDDFGDRDFIALELEYNGKYTLTLSGDDAPGALNDARIYGIFSDEGKLIPGTQNDDWDGYHDNSGTDASYDLNSRVDFLAPSAGTYFLSVGAYDDDGIGEYVVNVQQDLVDFNPEANKGEHLHDQYGAMFSILQIDDWEQTEEGQDTYFGDPDSDDHKDNYLLMAEIVDQLAIYGGEIDFSDNGDEPDDLWFSSLDYTLHLNGDITANEAGLFSGAIASAKVYGDDLNDLDSDSDTITYAKNSDLSADVSALLTIVDNIKAENSGYANLLEMNEYATPAFDITPKPVSATEIEFEFRPVEDQIQSYSNGDAGLGTYLFDLSFDPAVVSISDFTAHADQYGNMSGTETGLKTVGATAITLDPENNNNPVLYHPTSDEPLLSITVDLLDKSQIVEFTIDEIRMNNSEVGSVKEEFNFISREISGTVLTRGGEELHGVELTSISSIGDILDDTKTMMSNLDGQFASDFTFGVDLEVEANMDFANDRSSQSITPHDALEALRLSVGLETTVGSFTKFDLMAADFDGSGRVDSADARAILDYSVGVRGEVDHAGWVFVEGNAVEGNKQLDVSDLDVLADAHSNIDFVHNYETQFMIQDTNIELTGILIGDVSDTYSSLDIM